MKTRAATANVAASRAMAVGAPTRVTSAAAASGPITVAARPIPSSRPSTRSLGCPAALATAGASTYLALSPGPRTAPASATSTTSVLKCSIPAWCSTGIRPTTTTLTRSDVMLIRRGPTRSVTGPDSAWASTYGAISAIATKPVRVGEPVVASTNSGSGDHRQPGADQRDAVGGQQRDHRAQRAAGGGRRRRLGLGLVVIARPRGPGRR